MRLREVLFTWSVLLGVLALVAFFLSGCSLSPSAEFITALGKDPATVSVNIVYPYGTIKFCRTAILNGDVSCSDNGITVKSGTGGVVLPITVTPRFQMGPPESSGLNIPGPPTVGRPLPTQPR